jgi:RNA polymerase sigma-70 factor (ECF subfamily)
LKRDRTLDVKLVEAYKAGDQKAMATLVKRWHLTFCKKAYWILKDAHLSKDVAQDSWRIIMNKLHTLQNPEQFESWSLRIVYNKAMDVLRQQSRDRSKKYEIKDSITYAVEDYDEHLELKGALLKAIKGLSSQHQHVIKLFYLEEYSLKEISELLEISVGTTKSRLFHAREKLKQTLKIINYEN